MSDYSKSHEWVYNEYHKTENVVTKRSYLDILIRRANNGSKKAAEFVRKIEGSNNTSDKPVKSEEEIWCDYRETMYNAWAEQQKNK